MLFDFAIGNPPYNDEFNLIGNKTFAPPVYNDFIDAATTVAKKVELIHPARFLFNAGSTPKAWNKKMLEDIHFKVLQYEEDATLIFPDTDIKGGVAITYRDKEKDFGAIQIFTKYPELNSIVKKISSKIKSSLSDIIYTQNRFNLDNLYQDYPEYRVIIGSNGKDKRFRNNIFEKIPIFFETERENSYPTIGVLKNKRVYRYIDISYVDENHENLKKWKVLEARANGAGRFGEIISQPIVVGPNTAYTQTFIGIGSFDTEDEAISLQSYLKTKFLRTLLGVLKVTQDNDREVWRMIPVQDFSKGADIDWSKSIAEIDQQLYRKYGLSKEEISFIETNVKEME